MPESRPILDVDQVAKSYAGVAVLGGVSFHLDAGQKALLLGANGTGKSTLLRIIANLVEYDSGAVHVAGLHHARQCARVARHLGFVGHASFLYQDLSVEDNLLFYGTLYGLSRREADQRVRSLLDQVDLAPKRRDLVRSLSQGQLKRLSIARALLHDPSLLLLDEPFASLDTAGRAWLVELLQTDRRRTVLLATHQLDFPPEAADRVLILAEGHVRERMQGEHVWGPLPVW